MAPGRPERNYDALTLTVTQDGIRELAEYRRAERIMLERHLEPEVWLAEPGAPWVTVRVVPDALADADESNPRCRRVADGTGREGA